MKKLITIFWGALTTLIILVALSCDTTKPKPPVFLYELNLIHDAVESSVYADFNITTVNIIAELKDEDGNFIEGETISFTWENMDHAITLGTIDIPTLTTDNNGKVSVIFEDNGQAGLVEVTARFVDEYNNITTQNIDFPILSNEDQVSTLTVNSPNGNMVIVTDDAPETEYLTVFSAFVRDDLGDPVVNLNVHFTNLTLLGGLLNSQVMTNEIGKATVTLSTLGSELGDATIKSYINLNDLARAVESSPIPLTFSEYDFQHLERSDSEIADTLTVEFILQSQYLISHQVASMSLDAAPEIVQLDESVSDSVYTISLNSTVRDINGVAVQGVPVQFENMTPDFGTITSTNISTNASGVASTTLIASLEDEGSIQVRAKILDPSDPGTPAFVANESILLQTTSQLILDQVSNLNTWIVSGNIPNGNSNIANVDTIYARVTNSSGGSVPNVPVHFERISGDNIGVLSMTNVATNASGITKTVFTTLTSEIIQDSMAVSIQISVPGTTVDPQVRVFTFNFEGSEVKEYNVNRFDWYKGFAITNNSIVEEIFVGDIGSISVTSDYDYLIIIASVVDFEGVRIDRIPVQFSIDNDGLDPNGDLSYGEMLTCCLKDSLGGNMFPSPGDITLLNYVIDPGHPDEANGLVPILYYNQTVNVCDNVVSEIVDPFDNSVVLHTNILNICTVEEDTVNPIELVENLSFTTNPNNVALVDGVTDSTYRVILTATVRDEDGVPISDAPVQFINHTPTKGILLHGFGLSNSLGYARDTLLVTNEDYVQGSANQVQLEANVQTQPTPLSIDRTVSIYNYNPPLLAIDHLEAWPKNPIVQILDPRQVYTDTLYAKALTEGGAIIANAPVYFALTDPSVGNISANQMFTNAEGIASVIYYTSVGINPGSVEFVVSAPDYPNVPDVHKFIAVVGQNPPDLQVNTLTSNASPSEIVILEDVSDSTYSITFRAIAKDIYGVAVPLVPVYFQNLTPSLGALTLSLAFTDSVGVARSILNLENDSFGTANIKAYILSSENDNDTLFASYHHAVVMTELHKRLLLVTSLLSWPSSPEILVARMDSTYCDTLYAVAQDSSGGGVKDINVSFSINPMNLGYLTNSEATTDTSGSAQTTFCLVPGAINYDETDPGEIAATTSITVSIPGSTVDPDLFSIDIIDNLPECPDCTAELNMWANCYVLPGCPDSTLTTVFATYVDTLGYGPIDGTIIQFQSLEDSSGTWLPIGSINPWGQFQNDTARVTFNMTNDEGVAFIVGSYAGINDTINIVLNAGALEYLQFQSSYPSEIMVQGGGGLEATEINLELRDGSDNLVSNEYRIRFEITTPTPEGVHFDNGQQEVAVISSNGIASTTVNSGTHPGSIRIQARAYEIDDENYENEPIASAVGIPVTIATGPASFGNIAMSYVDLITPGGGIYQLPMSISLWDLHSNPVNDSTTVWLSLYESAPVWNPVIAWNQNSIVMWGPITLDTEGMESINMIDSLVYNCTYPDTLFIPPVCTEQPTTFLDGLSAQWTQNIHPGYIEAEAKTGELNMNGEAFRGIAWASSYYSSLQVFRDIIIKAHTYNGEGGYLLIDSRDNNAGAPFDQPVMPGEVSITRSIGSWDFSTNANFTNPSDMLPLAGCFTDIISINARLTDYYLEAISDGHLILFADGLDLLTTAPVDDPDWIPGLQQITDPEGNARWYVRGTILRCPVSNPQFCIDENACVACEYDDFTSSVIVQLTDPQPMISNQVEILLERSGGECENCPND
ncbi:MAG: hypothetical protein HQ510_05025 [Candidatus Marinimicrobia bacterium]|nr:hypothetical protein [Candidatus Neomarinimicrobiota bacterium]